jgi:acyl-coenzyme A thioesterase PaaI-like protein
MTQPSFQDTYPDQLAHCYGCGRLNEHGLHVNSYWDGDESVCLFQPKPYHTAIPGYVYGGLIASIIDCHSTGTASAAATRAAGLPMSPDSQLRFLTAALHVDYFRPTPIDAQLEVRAQIKELKGRKVVITSTLSANGQVCARGEVVCVQMPEHLQQGNGED